MAHTPYYDHANLTLRLPDFPNSPTSRKRRRSSKTQSYRADLLEVPQPLADSMSMRSNSSRTITPSVTIRSSPRSTPKSLDTSITTPRASFASLSSSSPPSLRNSPPFGPARTPTSSVFHAHGEISSHGYYHHHYDLLTSYHSEQPLQQPDTPVLSPSDDVIFPNSSSPGAPKDSNRMTPGGLGYNLQSMVLDPDTPPISPTPSPLVLSEPRGDHAGDYFSQKRTRVVQVNKPIGGEMKGGSSGHFPSNANMVATCASTVAGSISMQRWLRE